MATNDEGLEQPRTGPDVFDPSVGRPIERAAALLVMADAWDGRTRSPDASGRLEFDDPEIADQQRIFPARNEIRSGPPVQEEQVRLLLREYNVDAGAARRRDVRARRNLAEAVYSSPTVESMAALAFLSLRDPDALVRVSAASSYARFAVDIAPSIGVLRRGIRSRRPLVRDIAQATLS